jgi:hypothetical protein
VLHSRDCNSKSSSVWPTPAASVRSIAETICCLLSDLDGASTPFIRKKWQSRALRAALQAARARVEEGTYLAIAKLPSDHANIDRRIPMAKDEHNKAAEHHENAARSHRAAAEHHAKGDHTKGKEHSTSAQQHSQNARQHSEQAHTKSQQQK